MPSTGFTDLVRATNPSWTCSAGGCGLGGLWSDECMLVTPLHAALGLRESGLTFEMVADACLQRVEEREDLDFKRTLPLLASAGESSRRDAEQEALAKDIAAMANSRGGMIIYGVAESA